MFSFRCGEFNFIADFILQAKIFFISMGQTDVDLKNGMSIINLVNSRGYLPTCRILHMLLWMSSEVHDRQQLSRDYFVDVVSTNLVQFSSLFH
jgi:hypothetical protein